MPGGKSDAGAEGTSILNELIANMPGEQQDGSKKNKAKQSAGKATSAKEARGAIVVREKGELWNRRCLQAAFRSNDLSGSTNGHPMLNPRSR